VLVDRLLRRLAAEERGELAERAPVGNARRDVRPLTRVRAFREAPAELVEPGPVEQDAVGVVIDEREAVQYFRK
jgi:hypothetical protein